MNATQSIFVYMYQKPCIYIITYIYIYIYRERYICIHIERCARSICRFIIKITPLKLKSVGYMNTVNASSTVTTCRIHRYTDKQAINMWYIIVEQLQYVHCCGLGLPKRPGNRRQRISVFHLSKMKYCLNRLCKCGCRKRTFSYMLLSKQNFKNTMVYSLFNYIIAAS